MKKKLEHGLTRIWQVRKNSVPYFSLFAWFEQVTSSSFSTTSFFSSFLFNSQLLNHKFSSQKSPFPFSLQDVQLKVKAYILGTDMSNFKYDDFIVVLDVISRYAAGVRGANSSLSSLIGLHYLCCRCSFLLLVFFSCFSG